MCGRYSLGKKPRCWPEDADDFQPRYNIAPSQDAPVLLHDGSLIVRPMRWGLIPPWAEDESTGYKMINAKAVTVAEKPAFRQCLQKRRCVIPADGFFEWRKIARAKIPLRFTLHDNEPFGFAGLWERWYPRGRGAIESFTIITTEANGLVRSIHNRMPVILDGTAMMEWLDSARDFAALQSLFEPFPERLMRHYPVSSKINDARLDDPSCIEEVPELQSSLPGI